MRRRDFLAGGAAAAVLAPPAVAGQVRIWRIGFLGAASAAGYAALVEAFRSGLAARGYAEGRNLAFVFRWADGDYARLPVLAAELVHGNPDVIVTHGTPGALAAERATRTIPIVMAIIGDPVAAGVVSSIRHPDKNVTGSSFFAPQLAAKRIELLKDAIPNLQRVGLLLNPANPVMKPTVAAARQTAVAMGIDVEPVAVRDGGELPAALTAMVAKRAEAVVVPEDGVTIANARTIVTLCMGAKLPVIGFDQIVRAGGVMAYGVNIPATFRRAAYFVDKILRGSRPEDLPIEEASTFELTLNLKSMRALGLAVPPALLARADQVLE